MVYWSQRDILCISTISQVPPWGYLHGWASLIQSAFSTFHISPLHKVWILYCILAWSKSGSCQWVWITPLTTARVKIPVRACEKVARDLGSGHVFPLALWLPIPLRTIYRITPHTTRIFIHHNTYVKEGVRVINGYINITFLHWCFGAGRAW